MKRKRKTVMSKRGILGFAFTYIITPATLLFCIVSIISSKSEIAEKERELEAIQVKIEEYENENIEYKRILESNDIDAYMEKLAAENPELNYGIPNELRFYDTSRN